MGDDRLYGVSITEQVVKGGNAHDSMENETKDTMKACNTTASAVDLHRHKDKENAKGIMVHQMNKEIISNQAMSMEDEANNAAEMVHTEVEDSIGHSFGTVTQRRTVDAVLSPTASAKFANVPSKSTTPNRKHNWKIPLSKSPRVVNCPPPNMSLTQMFKQYEDQQERKSDKQQEPDAVHTHQRKQDEKRDDKRDQQNEQKLIAQRDSLVCETSQHVQRHDSSINTKRTETREKRIDYTMLDINASPFSKLRFAAKKFGATAPILQRKRSYVDETKGKEQASVSKTTTTAIAKLQQRLQSQLSSQSEKQSNNSLFWQPQPQSITEKQIEMDLLETFATGKRMKTSTEMRNRLQKLMTARNAVLEARQASSTQTMTPSLDTDTKLGSLSTSSKDGDKAEMIKKDNTKEREQQTKRQMTMQTNDKKPAMEDSFSGRQAVQKLSKVTKHRGGRTYTSKFRGVHQTFPTRRWEAQFRRKGKPTSLGCFDKEEQAARAYDKMMMWCQLHPKEIQNMSSCGGTSQTGYAPSFMSAKIFVTNFDKSEYYRDVPMLKQTSQDDLVAALRREGRKQASMANLNLKAKLNVDQRRIALKKAQAQHLHAVIATKVEETEEVDNQKAKNEQVCINDKKIEQDGNQVVEKKMTEAENCESDVK